MTRRNDPSWGSESEGKRGNRDSMHVTNAAPQMQAFNSPIWLELEDYALRNAVKDGMKVSVFFGSILPCGRPGLLQRSGADLLLEGHRLHPRSNRPALRYRLSDEPAPIFANGRGVRFRRVHFVASGHRHPSLDPVDRGGGRYQFRRSRRYRPAWHRGKHHRTKPTQTGALSQSYPLHIKDTSSRRLSARRYRPVRKVNQSVDDVMKPRHRLFDG